MELNTNPLLRNMKVKNKNTPSKKGQIVLDVLRIAVTNALDKKQKLGQYSVVWDGQKTVLSGRDAPSR